MDLKKTSYKKLSKLLAVFEKRGVLTQKLVHKQEHIATVNRVHGLYTAFAGTAPAAAEVHLLGSWSAHSSCTRLLYIGGLDTLTTLKMCSLELLLWGLGLVVIPGSAGLWNI